MYSNTQYHYKIIILIKDENNSFLVPLHTEAFKIAHVAHYMCPWFIPAAAGVHKFLTGWAAMSNQLLCAYISNHDAGIKGCVLPLA